MKTPPEELEPDPHAGDPADAELVAQVYEQLRMSARRLMNREGEGHTLQPTALVHEAFLRLSKHPRQKPWANDAHFFVSAAQAMERILIDHARSKHTLKRGGERKRTPIDILDLAARGDPADILALRDALASLQQKEERAAAVFRLRFYAGLSLDQIAEITGRASRSVSRDWAFARAWLLREIATGHEEDPHAR